MSILSNSNLLPNGRKKGKQILFLSFLQQLSIIIDSFVRRRLAFEQSLSARFEVHEGPMLSAAVSQLVATRHPNLILNTMIALSQI